MVQKEIEPSQNPKNILSITGKIMAIRSILSSFYENDKFDATSGKIPDATKKDKIELSEQAKTLQNTNETKNLDDIQKKIESGFYNTKEVISKVADAILKEIGK